MVVDQASRSDIDRIFQALADGTRRDIVSRVLGREHSVSSLAVRYGMSWAAVQKHVAVLQRAGLVTKERRGREQIVRGDPATVRRAQRLLDDYEQIWRGRASRIADLLTSTPADQHGTPTPNRGQKDE